MVVKVNFRISTLKYPQCPLRGGTWTHTHLNCKLPEQRAPTQACQTNLSITCSRNCGLAHSVPPAQERPTVFQVFSLPQHQFNSIALLVPCISSIFSQSSAAQLQQLRGRERECEGEQTRTAAQPCRPSTSSPSTSMCSPWTRQHRCEDPS